MAFPNSVHADQLSAFNDLMSKANSAGYTAIDTDLGERGLVASVLANFFKDLVADSLTGLTSSGTLSITAPGTAGAVNVIGTNGVLLNAGNAVKGLRVISQSLTPVPLTQAAAAFNEQLFTAGGISNITTADVIFLNPSVNFGSTLVGVGAVRVAGNGTIGITLYGGAITQTPTGGLVNIYALRT